MAYEWPLVDEKCRLILLSAGISGKVAGSIGHRDSPRVQPRPVTRPGLVGNGAHEETQQ